MVFLPLYHQFITEMQTNKTFISPMLFLLWLRRLALAGLSFYNTLSFGFWNNL
jgi:hypothetical protein